MIYCHLHKKLIIALAVLTVFGGLFSLAEAAVLSMFPKSGEIGVGQSFDLKIEVDSQGQGFNAAQATVQFPKDLLEVKSIDNSPTASIFNFWLEEPSFSNAEGKLSFIGGSTNGVSGAAIPILKISFLVKGAGEGDVVFSDAAVTASDGSGTNILSELQIAHFKFSPKVTAPAVIVPPPMPIVRRPAAASRLPAKPKLSVPLYPEPEKWHNFAADFLAQWELPLDVSGVSTALDLKHLPLAISEGLFDNKIFPAISENGIWHLRVRFGNNIGWGEPEDYHIKIDTFPPLPFEIDSLDGFRTDNPAPIINFQSADGLSGISHYLIRIGSGNFFEVKEDSLKLPLQAPGTRPILIRAVDQAGNFIENSAELEILPIESPTIKVLSKDGFVGEGDLVVGGTALSNVEVLLFLKKSHGGKPIVSRVVKADENGNWQRTFGRPLSKGLYEVEAQARDARGALSLPAVSEMIRIRERPLFTLGSFEVTQFWFFIGLIIILLSGFGAGWYSYRIWKAQIERKAVIAKRDVNSACNLVNRNIDKMLQSYKDKKISEQEAAEMEFLLKKTKSEIEKLQKYILEGIEEIPD